MTPLPIVREIFIGTVLAIMFVFLLCSAVIRSLIKRIKKSFYVVIYPERINELDSNFEARIHEVYFELSYGKNTW